MSIRSRLGRLERSVAGTPCPFCADQWGVLLTCRESPDGMRTQFPGSPATCAVCGKSPEVPMVIEKLVNPA